MQIGPVQLLVVTHASNEPDSGLRAEVERLSDEPGIRLLDILHLRKHDDGRVERLELSDPLAADEPGPGTTIAALIGLDAGEPGADIAAGPEHPSPDERRGLGGGVWYVDDVLPPGIAATLVLLEHRWATALRDEVRDAGASLAADAWVHPSDLVAIGLVTEDGATHELLF